MTKKHFEAFAKRLRDDMEETRRRFPADVQMVENAVTYAAYVFADTASAMNPRFDRDRFLKAAGVLR